jgi:hypothetical protein
MSVTRAIRYFPSCWGKFPVEKEQNPDRATTHRAPSHRTKVPALAVTSLCPRFLARLSFIFLGGARSYLINRSWEGLGVNRLQKTSSRAQKSRPRALKRERIFNDLTARLKVVPFPTRANQNRRQHCFQLVGGEGRATEVAFTGSCTATGSMPWGTLALGIGTAGRRRGLRDNRYCSWRRAAHNPSAPSGRLELRQLFAPRGSSLPASCSFQSPAIQVWAFEVTDRGRHSPGATCEPRECRMTCRLAHVHRVNPWFCEVRLPAY